MQLFAISLLSWEMSLNVSLLNTELFSAQQPECKPFTEELYGTVTPTNTEQNAKSWQKRLKWAPKIIESSASEQLHST